MTDKIKLTPDQVVSVKSGWVTYISASGSQYKARKSAVEIEGEHSGSTAVPPAPTHPVFSNEPPVEAAPPKPTGEKKMAKAKTKTAKKEPSGIRTIGGKAVDLKSYTKVKTASGGTSYNNGDEVADKLTGKSLEEVYDFAAAKLKVDVKELRSKYKHLNVGMQRMALGNRLRKVLLAKAA